MRCSRAKLPSFPSWNIIVMHFSHFLLGKKRKQCFKMFMGVEGQKKGRGAFEALPQRSQWTAR